MNWSVAATQLKTWLTVVGQRLLKLPWIHRALGRPTHTDFRIDSFNGVRIVSGLRPDGAVVAGVDRERAADLAIKADHLPHEVSTDNAAHNSPVHDGKGC